MTKISNKLIIITAISAVLSGCNVNTKPDHPQIRESFAERRSPVDNALAASGALGDENQDGSFVAVQDHRVGTAYDKQESSSKSSSSRFFGQNVAGGTSSSSSSSSSSSASDDSFFDRLWKKFFSDNTNSQSNFKVAQNRYHPAENVVAWEGQTIGQGGSETTVENFYETADDILPSTSTQKVLNASLEPIHNESKAVSDAKYGYLLANGNIAHSISSQASLSNVSSDSWQSVMSDSNPIHVADSGEHLKDMMVEDKPLSSSDEIANTLRNSQPMRTNPTAPEAPQAREDIASDSKDIPSIDKLREKAGEIKSPELVDVPKQIDTKPKAEGVKPHKSSNSSKYRDPIKDVDPSNFETKDPNAGLEYEEGKHIVRGTLGKIKN